MNIPEDIQLKIEKSADNCGVALVLLAMSLSTARAEPAPGRDPAA